MKKNVTAILLVFALLAGFASCRKLEDSEGFVIESKAYIVDSEGVTRDVQSIINDDGKTEYFYYDADGNKVPVKKKEVVVETNKVSVASSGESGTLSPEAQSFFDAYNDPEKFEELLDTDVTQPELVISDEVIPENTFKEIKVELGSDGKPIHTNIEKNYNDIVNSHKFTMDFVVKETMDGEEMTLPIVAIRDGENLYFETQMPVEGKGSMKFNFIITNGKCYIVIPAMRAYAEVPKEYVQEIIPSEIVTDDVEMEYVKSGEVVFEGKKYICDVYKSGNDTVKYYFADNELKRIETISGDNTSILEIKELSTKADSSKFKIPSNYFDMTKFLGENFQISDLA